MKDLGKTTICMGMELIHGATEGSMSANTIWTRSMAMEYITGLMVEGTKVTGKMENNMEKENISCRLE